MSPTVQRQLYRTRRSEHDSIRGVFVFSFFFISEYATLAYRDDNREPAAVVADKLRTRVYIYYIRDYGDGSSIEQDAGRTRRCTRRSRVFITPRYYRDGERSAAGWSPRIPSVVVVVVLNKRTGRFVRFLLSVPFIFRRGLVKRTRIYIYVSSS